MKAKTKKIFTDVQKDVINGRYLGKTEPKLGEHPTTAERSQYLTWCSYMVKKADAREWLDLWLKNNKRPSISSISDKWVSPSVCYRARLLNLNVYFSPEQMTLFENNLAEIYRHKGETTEDIEKIDRPTVQEHMAEKITNILGDLEGMIDDNVPINMEVFLREKAVNPRIAKDIILKFTPRQQELTEAAKWKDDELKEAYRHLGRAGVQKEAARYDNIISLTERFMTNSVKARAPRKKKVPSVEKKLKYLTDSFLKFSKDYNVNSIDPAKIIGAQELWVLDTKYKIITVFRAKGHGGQLDVHRTKIIGFDPNNSHSKRLGRRSVAIVDELIKATKAASKKIIMKLPDTTLKERINENCILLRI
jgi:hypothetical protein